MELVRAIEAFAIGNEVVAPGEIFDAEHPIVKATPASYWQPMAYRGVPVEEATARPGRKRPVKAAAEDAES